MLGTFYVLSVLMTTDGHKIEIREYFPTREECLAAIPIVTQINAASGTATDSIRCVAESQL